MFKGFSTPNYVQVPHEFFDIIMEYGYETKKERQGITKSEIKLLAFMIRNTFGWQKSGFSLQFTFTDIQEYTNMGRQQVNDAISKCLEKGYIVREEVDGKIFYRINLADEEEQLPITTSFDWKKRNKQKAKSIKKESGLKIKPSQFENQTDDGLKIKPSQFENQTDDGLKIKPDKNESSLVNSDSKHELKKVLKKESKKSIKENLSNLSSKTLRNWIEKQLQNDRLTDNKAQIIVDLYEEKRIVQDFSDVLFIEVCSNVLDYKHRNFKSYLKKSLQTTLSTSAVMELAVTEQETSGSDDKEKHPAHAIVSQVLQEEAGLPRSVKWQLAVNSVQKNLNVSWNEARGIVDELNML